MLFLYYRITLVLWLIRIKIALNNNSISRYASHEETRSNIIKFHSKRIGVCLFACLSNTQQNVWRMCVCNICVSDEFVLEKNKVYTFRNFISTVIWHVFINCIICDLVCGIRQKYFSTLKTRTLFTLQTQAYI